MMARDFITQEEEEDLFLDSRDCISSPTDSCPGSPSRSSRSFEDQLVCWSSYDPRFEVWVKDPVSVKERRDRFMKMLGVDMMNSSVHVSENPGEELKEGGEIQPDIQTVMSNCGAVLRNSSARHRCSLYSSSCDYTSTSGNGEFDESLVCRIKNLDNGTVSVANEVGKDGSLRSLQEVGSDQILKDPVSVKEHRDMMNRSPHVSENPSEELKEGSEIQPGIQRVISNCGAVLRNSSAGHRRSLCSSSCDYTSTGNEEFDESLVCRIKNLDNGTVFVANEVGKDGSLTSLREVGSDQILTLCDFQRSFGSSSLIQSFMRREDDALCNSERPVRRKRSGWLSRLRTASCILDKQWEASNSSFSDSWSGGGLRAGRVKVHPYKKRAKEFSAVYKGQQFKAHDGAILAMKFSPDGQYLATGGEDRVVRVWYVTERETAEEIGIPGGDPSCIYFTMNQSSELKPLYVDTDKKGKSRSSRITSDSVCVIIPPVAFQLSEEPLHEFHGHDGDVLDLSWSNNKSLLSSSVDKTVRMWKIGSDNCVKVFCHNDYVTSVQFNPVNEDYFITGSIDGKVRIWEIPGCHVVDWVDIREIVTAVCYRPDGKGIVVGTLKGNCRFYDASDNHLQLDAEASLQGKRKSSKRIIGFQFCPSNPHKLLVSSADSQIRILDGTDVVLKLKGIRNSGSQISASFTADGKHIISASDDSNVYMWNHASHAAPTSKYSKSIWSSEHFFSSSASIAIPWCGLQSRKSISNAFEDLCFKKDVFRDQAAVTGCQLNRPNTSSQSSSCFSLSHEFLEFPPRSAATWPEEKLPSSSSSFCKSYYKFLKNACQNTSHAWGQAIVTAGSNGWISTFQNYGLPQNL